VTIWKRVAGDGGDTLTAYLDGLDDLTAATGVVGKVTPLAGGASVTLAGSIVSASARTVRLTTGTWLAGLTKAAQYSLEFEITFPSGVVTWPSAKPDEIHVRASRG
jgi:hypothetical protein